MRVSEIMVTDPITVPDGAVLGEAERLMDEHRIRHLPVVRKETLVGVLSERDLLEVASKLAPRASQEGELVALLVRDLMRPTPFTVLPEDTLAKAARMLCEWGIGCLPVTRGKVLVGLLTDTDLLEALVGSSRYGALGIAKDPAVADCMTADPETADSETTLQAAAQRMHAGDFRHLPVTDVDGRLVGLISDRDLRGAAARGLAPTTKVIELARERPSTARGEEPISRAAGRMAQGRIGAQPVVDEHGKLQGILTVTDVLVHIAHVLG